MKYSVFAPTRHQTPPWNRVVLEVIDETTLEVAKEEASELYPGGCDLFDGVTVHTVDPKKDQSHVLHVHDDLQDGK